MAEVGEWRDLRERNQGRSTKTRLRSHGAFGPKPCGPMRALMHTSAQPSHRARSAHIGQSGTQAEYARTLCCMRASFGPAPYSDRRCVHHRRNDGPGEHRARTCRRAGALRHRRASVSAPSKNGATQRTARGRPILQWLRILCSRMERHIGPTPL